MTRRATTSARQATGSCELVERDPLVDQRAGVGAGDAGFGGAQVTQPAEAEQRDRPVLGRRRDLERRAGIADHDLAGEHEPAGIDLARAGCVGRAQILRRDDEAVGLAEGERPVDDRMGRDAAHDPANEAARQEHGQSGTFRDRNARHRGAGSHLAGDPPPIPTRANPSPVLDRKADHSGTAALRPTGNNPFKSFAIARHRSRPCRPFANQRRRDGRGACADRRPA